jgi:hypothetical protein
VICRRRGPVLSRRTADRIVRAHLAVTRASGLVTSQRRQITSARNVITGNSPKDSPLPRRIAV